MPDLVKTPSLTTGEQPPQGTGADTPEGTQDNLSVYAAVLEERQRQIARGFDAAHDDTHTDGELWGAAVAYLYADAKHWPFDAADFKPSKTHRDIVKGCALLLAESERLERIGESRAVQLVRSFFVAALGQDVPRNPKVSILNSTPKEEAPPSPAAAELPDKISGSNIPFFDCSLDKPMRSLGAVELSFDAVMAVLASLVEEMPRADWLYVRSKQQWRARALCSREQTTRVKLTYDPHRHTALLSVDGAVCTSVSLDASPRQIGRAVQQALATEARVRAEAAADFAAAFVRPVTRQR
jgi:hypothetical protein